MTRRVLLALFLVAGSLGLFSQLEGRSRAPETELIFLYHSGSAGEIEECG